MGTVARLKQGNLLVGNVNEKLPPVTSDLLCVYNFDDNLNKHIPGKIRYIKDSLPAGSTANNNGHWVEIQAFDKKGVNVALNKTSYMNGVPENLSPSLTNGQTSSDEWTTSNMSATAGYQTVDLGDLYEISTIKVWHYYPDGRTYYKTKTEVSDDGKNWYSIFDSRIEGEYAETSSGNIINLNHQTQTQTASWINGLWLSEFTCTATMAANEYSLDSNTKHNGSTVTLLKRKVVNTNINGSTNSPIGNVTTSFSLKFEGYIYCPQDGNYTFATDSDDASHIKVDGKLVYGWYNGHGVSGNWNYNGTINLTKGYHKFEYAMQQGSGGAAWRAAWKKPSDTAIDYIPAESFFIKPNVITSKGGVILTDTPQNLNDKTFTIYNNYGVPATLTKLNEKYMGNDIYRLKMTVTDEHSSRLSHFQTTRNAHGVYIAYTTTFLANTKYCASIIWRPVNKKDVQIGGTASNIGGWTDGITFNIDGEWFKSTAYRNGSVTENKTDNVFWSFISPSLALNEDIYIDFCCPQIESGRTHSNWYINKNEEMSESQLNIKLNNTRNAFTIFFKYKPMVDWSKHNWELPTTNKQIFRLFDKITGKYITYQDYTKGASDTTGDTNPWLGFDSFVTNTHNPWHWHHNIARTAGKEYCFALVKNGANIKMYYKGDKNNTVTSVASSSSTDQDIINMIPGEITFFGSYNFILKEFCSYDRDLTADEINKLFGTSLRIDQNSNLINEVEEKPYIPNNAFYFPLTFNANDYYNNITPVKSSNLVFQDGSVFVGNQNNLFNCPKDASTFGVKSVNLETITYTPKQVVYKYDCTKYTSGQHYAGNDVTVNTTSKYVFAVDVFVSEDCNLTTMPVYLEKGIGQALSYDLNKKGTWQTLMSTANVSTQTVVRPLMYPVMNTSSRPTTGYILYRNPRFFEKEYDCAFKNGNNGTGDLAYNFNSSIRLDWSKDWSIVYWKKPMGTQTNDLTGYNLESIGCNSNSVGGGYAWFGKESGSNAIKINSGSSAAFTPANYFNKYHMVSLVKNGTNVSYKCWGVGGVILISNSTLSTDKANYYVTQHGYDFKLGGWDNGNPTHSYFKDLMVAKRAFTDDELNKIYSTQMSNKGSKINLQGEIVETRIF